MKKHRYLLVIICLLMQVNSIDLIADTVRPEFSTNIVSDKAQYTYVFV